MFRAIQRYLRLLFQNVATGGLVITVVFGPGECPMGKLRYLLLCHVHAFALFADGPDISRGKTGLVLFCFLRIRTNKISMKPNNGRSSSPGLLFLSSSERIIFYWKPVWVYMNGEWCSGRKQFWMSNG